MTRSHFAGSSRVFHDILRPLMQPSHLSHAPGDGWTTVGWRALRFGWERQHFAEAFCSIALALHGVLTTENRCIIAKKSQHLRKSSNKQCSHCQAAHCCTKHSKEQRERCNYEPS